MKKSALFTAALVALSAFPAITGCNKETGSGDIKQVYSNLEHAKMYSLSEFGVDMDLDGNINVYDPAQINATACIKTPDGRTEYVPMFWYEEYESRISGKSEYMYKCGDGQMRVRYTPRLAGEHSMYLNIVRDGTVTRYPESGEIKFDVAAGTKDAFLSVADDKRTLVYDNGAPYVGIGNNFCGWEWAGVDNMGGTYDYAKWFNLLAASGGNMTQFDLCEGDQLEWTKRDGELEWSDLYGGLGVYNQKIAAKTDYKVELADSLGLFYRLTLFHWEDFDTESDSFPDWGWSRNPYNTANGGPVSDVGSFFTSPATKQKVKDFLRYVVARWGYSTNLMMYELFNEVDAPDMAWGAGKSYSACRNDIRSWHEEMAKYLKSIDAHSHMVTTSCADYNMGAELWSIKELDLTTFHRYTMYNGGASTYETVKILKNLITQRVNATDKPTVAGEFALSPGGNLQREFDREGVVFHNALYASTLSGSFGTAMSWTWGSYVDEYDLYYHYKAVSKLFKGASLANAVMFDNFATPAGDGVIWYQGMRAGDYTYLWVKDSKHDYIFTKDGYSPAHMLQGTVTLSGYDDGEYAVEWIDTYTGETVAETTANAAAGKLTVTYPAFTKDIAAKIISDKAYYESVNIYSGNNDDGYVPLRSYTAQNASALELYTSGHDIGGTADSGRFAYRTVTGDFTYTARVDSNNYGGSGAKAGIMVRESDATSSKMAFIGAMNGGDFVSIQRTAAGMQASFERYGIADMGTYVRITRTGNTLSTYVSEDGKSFTLVKATEYKSLKDTLLVGVMACNKNTYGYNKARFGDVTLKLGA